MPRYCLRTGRLPLCRLPHHRLIFVRPGADIAQANRTLIRLGW